MMPPLRLLPLCRLRMLLLQVLWLLRLASPTLLHPLLLPWLLRMPQPVLHLLPQFLKQMLLPVKLLPHKVQQMPRLTLTMPPRLLVNLQRLLLLRWYLSKMLMRPRLLPLHLRTPPLPLLPLLLHLKVLPLQAK
jgi:hypothetical protein